MRNLFLISIVFLFSCDDDYYSSNKFKKQSSKEFTKEAGNYLREIEHDGCEYVYVKTGYAGGLTHKGNCKNH